MPGVGDTVDRYVIEAVLGEGGMGRVYRALDPRLGRRVALKVLLAEGASPTVRAEAAARMVREARAAAAFSHPNVVAVHDVGEAEGAPYITMELVSGRTLREYVGDGQLSNDQKVAWLKDVARGLGAAHRAGLVHRDIKPENVMVTTEGGREGARLRGGKAYRGRDQRRLGSTYCGGRATVAHCRGDDDRDASVHGAGAAAGNGARRACGSVCLGGHGVGAARWRSSVGYAAERRAARGGGAGHAGAPALRGNSDGPGSRERRRRAQPLEGSHWALRDDGRPPRCARGTARGDSHPAE